MQHDRVYIECLALETVIGIYDWERKKKQIVELDLEIKIDGTAAASADDISQTINYDSITTALREAAASTEFQLLEALGLHLTHVIEDSFPTPWFKMKLRKPNVVPYTNACGIIIERHYDHG